MYITNIAVLDTPAHVQPNENLNTTTILHSDVDFTYHPKRISALALLPMKFQIFCLSFSTHQIKLGP